MSNMFNYQHGTTTMDPWDSNPNLKHDEESNQLTLTEYAFINHDEWILKDEKDYNHHDDITSWPTHFPKGKLDIGKVLLPNDDINIFVKQTLAQVINEEFKIQPNWTTTKYVVKVDVILDIQEYIDQYKQPPHIQLEVLVNSLYNLDQDRINHTN